MSGARETSDSRTETEPLLDPEQHADSTIGIGPDGAVLPKIVATVSSFAVLGMLTSTTGVLLPHVERWYNVNDIQASAMFVVGPVGYVCGSQLNQSVHSRYGQRGVAVIGPILHFLHAVSSASRPPFILFLASMAVGAFGSGLVDGSWCAWAAGLSNANAVSGILHGAFSAGASLGPILAGTVISSEKNNWYQWYYVMAGIFFLEAALLSTVFRSENAQRYREAKSTTLETSSSSVRFIVTQPAVWMCALYMLVYVGTESAVSGWVITFMARARHASPFLSGLCSTTFWIGMSAGRLSLGFLADKFGVRRANGFYIGAAVITQSLFIFVKAPSLAPVLMALLGCFFGPLFPSGVILMASMLSDEAHVAAVSSVVSVGQVGASLLPFATGVMVQEIGIEIFQYLIIIQLAVAFLVWTAFAKIQPPRVSAGPLGRRAHEE